MGEDEQIGAPVHMCNDHVNKNIFSDGSLEQDKVLEEGIRILHCGEVGKGCAGVRIGRQSFTFVLESVNRFGHE